MAEVINNGISAISIEEEMQKSYLDYAMSVIVSRALPDVRDGLKPVHRRVLYAQHEMSNEWNRAYKKSARIVGDVMGKYHPHGDLAIYDALVRMAQNFSLRLPLEDGQGNFGSMDGDKAAAMRYTEVRMSKAASFMLKDIDKDTVDFRPNYDGNDHEPVVLPTRFPNLLVNGSSGIAVGMATNIPPHNLGEVIDASVQLIDNPDTTGEELEQFVKGPDFPTGGIVIGTAGIKSALSTGRGSVVIRGRTHTEEVKSGREAIIITEIPYQVNKARLVERIAELVKEKLISGIADLRDESDRNGVRVVVELKREANPDVVLSQLFKHTPLQSSFGYNVLALDRGRPRQLNLRGVLKCFLRHREDVITRRTRHLLRKARDRAHVLAGLAIAVGNIDDVIAIVRNAPDPGTAKAQLMDRSWPAEQALTLLQLLAEDLEDDGKSYKLSAIQAQAILDLRLHRLTGLERDKINEEANEIASTIEGLLEILSERSVMLGILKDELLEAREMFDTPRRTSIEEGSADVNLEDLIKPEDMVVTISTDGYVKRQPMSTYRAQRRGGKGRNLATMKDEEQIETVFVANTHDPLLYFTSTGQVYKLKVYELPLTSSGARGKAFVNLLPLEKDERVMRVVPVPRNTDEWENLVLLFATEQGLIRKTPLSAFNNVYSTGIKGMGLNDGDRLIAIQLAHEDEGDVIISSLHGSAVRFPVNALRPIASRTAYGVKGMNLRERDKVISMYAISPEDQYILSITEHGYGKRTKVDDFPIKGRGTMGVISIKTTDRNGNVVTSMPVNDGDQVMMITSNGQAIRTGVEDISIIGRNTQGVRLFKVDKGSSVSTVTRIPEDMLADDEDDEEAMEALAEDGVIAETAAEGAEVTEAVEAPDKPTE